MSQKIRLSSKLPGDEAINGLDQLADSLVEHPRPVCAIVWFTVPRASVTYGPKGEIVETVPNLVVAKVEPLGSELSEIPEGIIKAAQEAERRRTGRQPLPFDEFSASMVEDDDDSPNRPHLV